MGLKQKIWDILTSWRKEWLGTSLTVDEDASLLDLQNRFMNLLDDDAIKELIDIVKACPLVPNITLLSIGERSQLLGKHSIELDEWYHKLKQFLVGLWKRSY